MKRHGDDEVGSACRRVFSQLPRSEKSKRTAVLDLSAVLETMYYLPDRSLEEHSGAGRSKGRRFFHTGAATVVSPSLGEKRETAERAAGRRYKGAFVEASGTEMNFTCIGYKGFAPVAEGWEENVEKRFQEH